MKGVIV